MTEKEDNVNSLVGYPDGYVLGDEKIVYDYDEDGNFLGWHKEVVENG